MVGLADNQMTETLEARKVLVPRLVLTSLEPHEAHQRKVKTRRSGKMAQEWVKSTRRFARSIGISTMSKDLRDQSYQTTFRTEIYTSEEEGDAVNYYAFISNYKKEVLDENAHLLKMKKTTFFEESVSAPQNEGS